MSAWRIDRAVAGDLAALVGWAPGDGASALAGRMGGAIPTGSTAKLEAIAAGQTPPGADPEAIARRVLADREVGRAEVSWSCWAMSTLMAAVIETLEDRCVEVAAIRRIDDSAPPVDVHSVVAVDGLLCDPYFASVVPAAGPEDERVTDGVWCRRTDEADGRWALAVWNGRWPIALEYRALAPVVDRHDVDAFCVVSVAHTGAPMRPYARLWRPPVGIDAFVHEAGGAAVRSWRAGADLVEGPTDQVEHADWASAAAEFAERTGVPLA